MRHSNRKPKTWPPEEYRLPDNLEEIERGRTRQRELFSEVPDDSRQARLARLTEARVSVASAKSVNQDSLGCVPDGLDESKPIGSNSP